MNVGVVTGRRARSLCVRGLSLLALASVAGAANAASDPGRRCLVASGGAARACAKRYGAALRACRDEASSDCEAALRQDGGRLSELLAKTEGPVRRACTESAAGELNFLLGLEDLVTRTAEACEEWGEEIVAISYAHEPTARAADALACQRTVGAEIGRLHDGATGTYGRCQKALFGGRACDRTRRDARLARAKAVAVSHVERRCGSSFDALGLVPGDASPTLEGRIEALAELALGRARHLAERVYPAFPLGPAGLFGPAPVGVRTLDLVDPVRLDVGGNGPRPLQTELYYPSTAAGVAGVPRDVVRVFDVDLFTTPTYRDVPLAPGTYPLVLFSPGSPSSQWGYVYLLAHLASHGILVAAIDHHGDQFPTTTDPDRLTNRPLDLSAVLDQLLAPGDGPASFVAGAIDPERIGAEGHSAGGYTATALSICPLPGAFSDARIKAVVTLESGLQLFPRQAPGIFSTISVPTLLLAGASTPLAALSQAEFDAFTPGPTVVGYGQLTDALHNSFGDLCEVPAAILTPVPPVGPKAECQPAALPWRLARYLTNYLSLSFFEATLDGSAEALARLDPALLAQVEELRVQRKSCETESCEVVCQVPCGDGTLEAGEACDLPGEQGLCAAGALCNDNCTTCVACDDATPIPPEGGVLTGTTVGAASALGSSCGGDFFAAERIFTWTPSTSHVAAIRTTGGTTNYDSTLYVREGGCLGADLACNDDAGAGVLQSSLTIPVVAGTHYFVVVDGFGVAAGNFTLSVDVAD